MINVKELKAETTDKLIEVYHWIKDRAAYCRACHIENNSDVCIEYPIIDELAKRGINVVEIKAALV